MRDSGKCATPKCCSLTEGFALRFTFLLIRFLEQNISGIRNCQDWTQLRKKLLFQKLTERRVGCISFPIHDKTPYIHSGLAHLLKVASASQAFMCFAYHNTCERLLSKTLQPSLSEQRISLRAAPASKQRRAIYIHALRKKGRGGELVWHRVQAKYHWACHYWIVDDLVLS